MSRIKTMVRSHPLIAAWTALAAAMVVMLVFAAREVGLQPTQWAVMIVSTVLLAGACVWITTWK